MIAIERMGLGQDEKLILEEHTWSRPATRRKMEATMPRAAVQGATHVLQCNDPAQNNG